jgi:hypothetical protein
MWHSSFPNKWRLRGKAIAKTLTLADGQNLISDTLLYSYRTPTKATRSKREDPACVL